jgi:uncharacterized repeat protein (TIGR02543 family)
MKRSPSVLALVITSILVLSCHNPFQRNAPSIAETGTGALAVTIQPSPALGRTLLPSIDDRTPVSFNLSGTGPAGATFNQASLSTGSHQIPGLSAGSWTIEASGQNSSGVTIAFGQISTEILAGETRFVTLVLHVADGTGGIEIIITWPVTVTTPSFVVTLAEVPTGANPQSLSVNFLSATSAEITQYGISSGSHMLRVGFYNNAEFLCAPVESVVVLNGVTTRGTVSILAEHIKRPPSAPTDLMAEELSDTLVRLSWHDTSPTEEYFIIEWQDEGESFWTEQPDQIAPNTTSFDAPAPASGILRYYRVKAVNPFGSSAWSNEASAMARVAIDLGWFADLNLRQAVADAGLLYVDELTNLNAGNRSITDLTGLDRLTELSSLVLVNNQISDLTALSSLSRLSGLSLDDNLISNIGPLSSLPDLNFLSLSFNAITDLSALGSLVNLTNLYLKNNQIIDASPLSGLLTLIDLHLDGNQLTDVSAMANLTNLVALNLSNNQISTGVATLVALSNATSIYLSGEGNSEIPIADRQILEASLPDCELLWPPLPNNYSIGDMGPAGGIVFYENPNYEVDGWRWMEAWTADEPGPYYQWKTSNTSTSGTSNIIGSGYANTYMAMGGVEHPAAEVCRNASHGGYYDWFLASKDELNLMYLQREVIGGLSSSYYWSSSEDNSYSAFGQTFVNGGQHVFLKDSGDGGDGNYIRIRVVRAFKVDEPTQQYTLNYNATGASAGTVPTQSTATAGTSLIIESQGNLRGTLITDGITQRFTGWNTQSDGSGPYYQPGETLIMPPSHLTMYAQWTDDGDVIGKVGPAGGIVFYENPNHEVDSWRYLEAWAADEPGTYQWKTSYTETIGTSAAIGSGYSNTYTSMIGIEHPAAEVCRNVSHAGFTDWFLPSKDELNFLYLQRAFLGVFASEYYWSSSQYAYTEDAWIQFFYDGSQYRVNKVDYLRVRVIRAFGGTPTLNYNSNGGTGNISAQPMSTGATTTLASNNFTRSGYTFTGWNTQPDGSGTSYEVGASFTIGINSVTLYAQWEAIPVGTVELTITTPGEPTLSINHESQLDVRRNDLLEVVASIAGTTSFGYEWYVDGNLIQTSGDTFNYSVSAGASLGAIIRITVVADTDAGVREASFTLRVVE